MSEKKVTRWKLRVADDLDGRDAEALGKFTASFAPPGVSPDERRSHSGEYYLWKLGANPAGKGFVSLAMDGDRIVGTTTVTRKRMHFKGKLIEAAEIGDTFTDPEYQRQGIFSALVTATRDRAVAAGVRLIYGTPNTNSLPGYEKNVAFRRKSNLDLQLFFLPVQPAGVAGFRLRRAIPASGALDALPAAYLKCVAGLMAGSCEEEELSFGPEHDELFVRTQSLHGATLSRTSDDLAYRLSKNPDALRYKVIASRNRAGRLEGYLIWKDVVQQGMRVLWIADCVASAPGVESKLWSAAIRAAARGGHHLIAAWLPMRMGTFLARLPVPPIPIHSVPVIFYDHDLGAEALSSDLSLRFSVLDSDNI